MPRKRYITLVFALTFVFCHAQETIIKRKDWLFIESQGLLPGSLAFGYERLLHLDKWFRYTVRSGIGPNANFGFYAMAGNSLVIGRKVNGEIGLNYIYNHCSTGLLAPGGSRESGFQPIIGIRIQNLKIPMSFRIFYEIPHGNGEYVTGCGVFVGYAF